MTDRGRRLRAHAVVYREWVTGRTGEAGLAPDDRFAIPDQEDELLAISQDAFTEQFVAGQPPEC